MVCQEPTSTPTGMSRPRPFADSRAATAALLKASAPMPYTVSVGITTSRPPLSAPTAEAIPRERWSRSAQSNTSVIGAAPPQRFALHRRGAVIGAAPPQRFALHRRGAVIGAAPPQRFALHRRGAGH